LTIGILQWGKLERVRTGDERTDVADAFCMAQHDEPPISATARAVGNSLIPVGAIETQVVNFSSSKPTGCGPWDRSSLENDIVYLRINNRSKPLSKRATDDQQATANRDKRGRLRRHGLTDMPLSSRSV
jgi:hypothetical protein